MKYLLVNTHYLPDFQYGGVVESGSKLFKFLKTFADFRVVAVSRNPNNSRKILGPNDKCYRSFFFHRFGVSFSAIPGLFKDIVNCDAALINGIFTFPVTLAALYATMIGKPFIVATRGGLESWCLSHKKWKKYFYIRFITLPLMRRAAYVYVTSDEEEKNIRSMGFPNVIKVSNGIDPEEFAVLPAKASLSEEFDGKFVFLFLSRTDREKGLDILIEAYRNFCIKVPKEKHVLLIVGPDHQGYLKNMCLNYEKENIVHISGIYDIDKIKTLRQADVLILPSYSENFGNVVAEALALETPVITTTGTPWKKIEALGCGLYIKPDMEELLKAMEMMYKKSPAERSEMGRLGRKYILDNFNWKDKAKELFRYLQVISGEKPKS